MTVHAAGYTRQSAARENKSEASPASQRAANKARFDQVTGEAVWCGHYEDIGISAFSGKVRPDFERLLRDCRAGRVNMIIVYYVSRLSRMEPLDAIPIVTELLNLGVVIVSVTEGEFRKGNLMDLIHLIMRLDAAHQESKNKSIAVKGAAKAARDLGATSGARHRTAGSFGKRSGRTPKVALSLFRFSTPTRLRRTSSETCGRRSSATTTYRASQ